MRRTIELPEELNHRLEREAGRVGLEPEEFVRLSLEQMLPPTPKVERRPAPVALLDQWYNEPPDLEDEEWDPVESAPRSHREVPPD